MGTDEKELELKNRRIIYKYILKNPGLHERELARQLNMPLSTLDYHLYYLKKRELVITTNDGHYTLFYASGEISAKDKVILASLRHKATRKIIIFLLLNFSAPHNEIHEHIGLAASTTSFHLKKLIDKNILICKQKGRETYYSVNDANYVSDLILSYKKSFLDDTVNRFADTWLELHPRHLKSKKKK